MLHDRQLLVERRGVVHALGGHLLDVGLGECIPALGHGPCLITERDDGCGLVVLCLDLGCFLGCLDGLSFRPVRGAFGCALGCALFAVFEALAPALGPVCDALIDPFLPLHPLLALAGDGKHGLFQIAFALTGVDQRDTGSGLLHVLAVQVVNLGVDLLRRHAFGGCRGHGGKVGKWMAEVFGELLAGPAFGRLDGVERLLLLLGGQRIDDARLPVKLQCPQVARLGDCRSVGLRERARPPGLLGGKLDALRHVLGPRCFVLSFDRHQAGGKLLKHDADVLRVRGRVAARLLQLLRDGGGVALHVLALHVKHLLLLPVVVPLRLRLHQLRDVLHDLHPHLHVGRFVARLDRIDLVLNLLPGFVRIQGKHVVHVVLNLFDDAISLVGGVVCLGAIHQVRVAEELVQLAAAVGDLVDGLPLCGHGHALQKLALVAILQLLRCLDLGKAVENLHGARQAAGEAVLLRGKHCPWFMLTLIGVGPFWTRRDSRGPLDCRS